MLTLQKNFAYNWYDGLTGIVVQPYKGAKAEGVTGFAKGVGKGTAGFFTHGLAASFGLLAYPSQGVYRSARNAVKSGTQEQIYNAARAVREYRRTLVDVEEERKAVAIFDEVCKKT